MKPSTKSRFSPKRLRRNEYYALASNNGYILEQSIARTQADTWNNAMDAFFSREHLTALGWKMAIIEVNIIKIKEEAK